MLKVLVACEFSGRVRNAFTALGADAMSCDILPTELPGMHYQGDVREILSDGWDVLIAHPPCTYLAVSGARWFTDIDRQLEQAKSLEFVRELLYAPIPFIALENPVSVISTQIRKPDQIIHPWQFGHLDKKSTCLWLKGLPLLQPTEIIPASARTDTVLNMADTPGRQIERSRTYKGIAIAMASQWYSWCCQQKDVI